MKRPLKEIMAGMSTQEKISYIWEYYKYLIIAIIVLIIAIVYTFIAVATKKDDVLNIMLMTQYAYPEKVEEVQEVLYNEFLTEEERNKSKIVIQSVTPNPDGSNIQAGMEMQKMVAELSAGMIDIFIADETFFESMNNNQQLLPLQQLKGLDPIPFPEEKLYYSDEKNVTGIDISSIELFDGLMYEDTEKVLFSPINSKKQDYIVRFIQYLGEMENEKPES